MAKAKKRKAKKAAKAVKARKAPAKKIKASKAKAKKAKKPVKAKARKIVKAAKKAAPKKAAAKKPAPKQKMIGEGDYEASRTFLKDQAGFVKKNQAKIPAMGKQAEMALEGPEGESLRAAEAEAASHSRAAE